MLVKIGKTTLLTLVLIISSVTLLQTFPTANAQLASQQPVSGPLPSGITVDAIVETRAFLSFRPNPIGLGQSLIVNMWINPGVSSNERLIPQGYVITITKPDGTKNTMTIDSEPATAANWFEISPDQIGTWKLKFEFLGTYFPAGRYYNGKIVTNSSGTLYGSAYYQPSSTQEQTLTVQQDFVASWPPAALPTDYWTRPGSLNNREWWPILGNFPGDGYNGNGKSNWDKLYPDTNPYDSNGVYNFIPWVQAPNTAHVVWKRLGAVSGLIGGPAGQYGTTSSPGNPSVVYAGRCYQTVTKPSTGSVAQCYDLRTGEIYYEIAGGITPTDVIYYNPVASSSTIAGGELASSSWSVELISISGSYLRKVNPYTGAMAGNYSISPLSGGTLYNSLGGYILNVQDLGAAAANTTGGRYRLINWTTRGTSNTIASRIVSNISWPWNQLPNTYSGGVGILVADFNAGLAGYVTRTYQTGSNIYWGVNVTGASLKTGAMMSWKVSLPDEGTYSGSCVVADHGKVAFLTQKGYFLAYDLNTGQLAWKSETMEYPWGSPSFGAYAIQSAYGMLYRQSYDGVYAFNWTNGKIVWKYAAPTYAHFETPYIEDGVEVYSFNGGAEIADGKMYVANTEHTPTWPLTRGWGLHCINITTGELVWKVNNPMSQGAIADGYMTAANGWDGYMYVFGKGKSATTVTAPLTEISKGSSVMIQGTVLDQSPAQSGTPCVSKDSMETQMEYLHLQMPIDGLWHNTTMTGVPVSLTAIASDGSYKDIATVTTDPYHGTFDCAWTPPNEDTYRIIASFTGDDSYGSSSAATAITVGPAPAQITIPEQAVPQDYTLTIIGSAIAVIIAVAIVGVLTLRKK
jgi:PQQ-like domain